MHCKVIVIKIIIIQIFLIGINSAFAQNVQVIKDSVQIQIFNEYIDFVSKSEKDSAVSSSPFYGYKVKYRTICPYKVFGTTEIKNDSCFCRQDPAIVMDTCVYNIESIISKKLHLSKQLFQMNGFEAVSFEKSNYVILTKSYLINIGNYTSSGIKETFFLERIKGM